MAVFTTARTTAFIPALSPPEVSTASFIFGFVLILGLLGDIGVAGGEDIDVEVAAIMLMNVCGGD